MGSEHGRSKHHLPDPGVAGGFAADAAERGLEGDAARGPAPQEERLGHYVVKRPLGRGGMGEVLLAWDERLERHVAIKRVRGDRTMDPRSRARFRREARAIARLSHPVIVQIYDLLDVDDGEAIVMEYVEGIDLARLLAGMSAGAGAGGLGIELALGLAAELADGLVEAHARGILHRDLKAENVMITPSGHVKLLDFGLAYHLFGEAPQGEGGSLTESGVLVGTAHAMSPEQARGGTLDQRSDLFALGGVLYAMLTGQPPFRGADLVDTLHRITREPIVAVRALRPEVPEALGALVERLLAKEPSERPAGAQEVARTLARIARGRGLAIGTGRTGALAHADQRSARESGEGEDGDGGDGGALEELRARALADELAMRSTASAMTAGPAMNSPMPETLAVEDEARRRGAAQGPRTVEPAARPRRAPRWLAGGMSLALAIALVIAVRLAREAHEAQGGEREARALAERRRAQAEALVQFMLGDLRARLEPLGQVAVLDAVGEQALAYFAAVPESELSASELASRATALHQVGQVRVAQGKLAEATRVFREALRLAEDLAKRDPASSARQFELGQSYFWLGYLLWQQKELPAALGPLRAYLRISEGLVARDPRNRAWMLELAYAHSNLGSIQRELGELVAAQAALGAAAGLMETLRAQAPGDDALLLELAHVQAKLGELLAERGELEQAQPWLQRYLDALRGLVARAPDDLQRLRFLGYAHSHLGNLLRRRGELGGALAHYREDLAIAERLARHDPGDRSLAAELALRQNKVADLLMLRHELAPARALLEEERHLVEGLLAADPTRAEWRLARTRSELSLAALLAAHGQLAAAIARARAATGALQQLVREHAEVQTFAVWLPHAWWQLGLLLQRAGRLDEARACWWIGLTQSRTRAAPAEGQASEPGLRDLQARLALALGRRDEARPILEELDRMGYRSPELMEARRALQ